MSKLNFEQTWVALRTLCHGKKMEVAWQGLAAVMNDGIFVIDETLIERNIDHEHRRICTTD